MMASSLPFLLVEFFFSLFFTLFLILNNLFTSNKVDTLFDILLQGFFTFL